MRILLLLLALHTTALFGQRAQKALDTLHKKYPQEKVVLDFSKPEYAAGETILFKAYVLTGYELSKLSTNLYTELYDKHKKLLSKQIVPLFNGAGAGSFALPASMTEDVYYIRAYTHWMLNFSERFQYITPVLVYNPFSVTRLQPKAAAWTAKAVVEGGQMIVDVPARVAVRISSEGTMPASWSGKLVERETGDSLTTVTVFNNEIGEVRFVPQINKTYVIQLKDAAGKATEIPLARPKPKGIAFNSAISSNKLYYTIVFNGVPSKGVGYKLLGSIQDQVVFLANVQKSDGQVNGSIAIDSFPPGVLRISLFDEREIPVAERLLFLHQQNITKTDPELITDTFSLEPREYNTWRFAIDTLHALSYSVQVNDGAYTPEASFLSSIYLTSDFYNPIWQASWYLQNVDAEKKEALDALLITEEWERFRWMNLMQGNYPVIDHPTDAYLTYSGTVSGGRQIKPLRTLNLLFQTKASTLSFSQVKTDSSGTFVLKELLFTDTVNVFYQPDKKGFFEPTLKIDFGLENKFFPYKKEFPSVPWTVESRHKADSVPWAIQKSVMQINNEQLAGKRAKFMQEVIVRTKAKKATEELDKKLSSELFSVSNAIIFDFINDDYTSAAGYGNILIWMQGRVPGYSISMNGNVIQPMIRDRPAQIFVDELPVEPEFLNMLATNVIAMIKVIKGSFAGTGSDGAIAIYTRRGGTNSRNYTSSWLTGKLVGYAEQPPIFSPDYSVPANLEIADDRLVLFRETMPELMDGKQQFKIRFYNNASARSFYLRITGFDQNGLPVYVNKLLK